MNGLTIFSAPKPFSDMHIAMIQRNAILSWKQLGSAVEVILIGEETGLAEFAREAGVRHIPTVRRNVDGTPLISDMLQIARKEASFDQLCLINADIILLPGFVDTVSDIAQTTKDYLVLGRRWDVEIREPLDFANGWNQNLKHGIQQTGKLHKSKGSDYFVFDKAQFQDMPDFAIGRAGWDNWTIYSARQNGLRVIDATHDITIVHQQHDYSHLPGGIIHYTLPESDENLKLAGGKRHIFTLLDSNRLLVDGKVETIPLSWKKLIREFEILPVLHSNNKFLMDLFFYITHPAKFLRHKLPGLAKILGIKKPIDREEDQ